MSNSVVKVMDVKDEAFDDSLLLLVGEDGNVTPDQATVETFLKQRSGPTNLQIMKINRSEKQAIDITVDNVTYLPDIVNEEVVSTEGVIDDVARNLYNFRLDHDYTPLTSPRSSTHEDEDELVRTLSILDGPDHNNTMVPLDSLEPPPLIMATPTKNKSGAKIKLIQSITLTPANKMVNNSISPNSEKSMPASSVSSDSSGASKTYEDSSDTKDDSDNQKNTVNTYSTRKLNDSQAARQLLSTPTTSKPTAKIIKREPKSTRKSDVKATKPKSKVKEMTDQSDEESEDFDFEIEDDENDSDFDFDQEVKTKQLPKRITTRSKSESKSTVKFSRARKKNKDKLKTDVTVTPNTEQVVEKVLDKPAEKDTLPEQKSDKVDLKHAEKKPIPKRKKEVPKPVLDDFALFSTPDIIRRVGGKEPTTPGIGKEPTTPVSSKEAYYQKTEPGSSTKPAKISEVSRTKSTESFQSPTRSNRSSLDSKNDKDKSVTNHYHEYKIKEKKSSTGDKMKHMSTDDKIKETKQEKYLADSRRIVKTAENILNSDEIPSAEDIRSIIMNEDTKSFTTGSLPIDLNNHHNMDTNNLSLDTGALELDPTILDNLNNDELSEDILYQVAQSLVSNPELQNAIDKGINEGVLDPMGGVHQNIITNHNTSTQMSVDETGQKGTQIVRPDGRIVVIPPIERPTTRSRNKRREESKPVFKPVHKPLDEEHVSGNELDSSNEEEESEDDPNKLWCICNQPHNNRFMICCDTCEEWYHGKCVNITKAMGQQMESEGKEWICLFCKDPMLKRPQAAARRVRKASRASRASTDSCGSATKREENVPNAVPCVVCQKTARKNSIYCSEACILTHAQGIERVVVFERATGKMLTGNKAPSAANLDQWLKEHVGYEVLRSGGKVVTAKPGVSLTQSKLKIVKNTNSHGVSLMVQKKGVSVGVLKHSPLPPPEPQPKPILKISVSGTKNVQKHQTPSKEPRTKLIQPRPIPKPDNITPTKQQKTTQNNVVKSNPLVIKAKDVKVNKEKVVPKTPKPKPKEEPSKEQPKQQEDIRENVQKTVSEQLTNRLKTCTDLKLTDDEVKNISIEIELQLFKYFGDTSQKYRNKYRSLIFNIKDAKNQTLWRRICEKAISAFDLVRLSPDDLASQELAMWREREAKHQLDMIKKSELELLNCNRQYVLKTHKGEQVVEDDRGDKVDNTEVIKSLTEGSALNAAEVKHDSKDRDKKGSSKHSHKDKIKDKDRDRDKKSAKDKDHRNRRSSSRDRSRERTRDSRKRSRSRDRRHVDHKKHSRSKDRDKNRHRKSAHKSSRHKKEIISSTDKLDKKSKEILEQLVDSKIVPPLEDRLWKHVPQEDIFPAAESDSDHEPSSTVTIPTPPRSQDDEFLSPVDLKNEPVSPEKEKYPSEVEKSTSPPPKSKPVEIWRGVINMIDVAQISITAHEVSGDCTGLSRELSDNLDIVGRISPDTVWEYIGKMKCSNSKGISLIRLNATNIEEKMPYLALYSYLNSRDRLGVVKSLNRAVKDFYIYPLAPQKPIPQVLLPLNGPGFEESRPALLLGIIVRDKRKRPNMEIPSLSLPKKTKIDVIVAAQSPPVAVPTPPLNPRSYTPPPQKDPRLKLPPPPILPADVPALGKDDEGDEPYSPGDSSPDMPLALTDPPPPPPILQNAIPPVADPPSSYTTIPTLPSSTQEIQRQMEELNKKIEMQKSEITSMTQNIVSASTEIGTSALANIALPSNLQQILDSIKTIGETNELNSPKELSQPDLTIPLMIPKTFTPRATVPVKAELPKDTIPLKLPSKPKIKPPSVNSPLLEEKVSTSVLGSLTEEDLIKKAAEMLGEETNSGSSSSNSSRKRLEIPPLPPTPPKRMKMDVSLPPVPGLEDDIL